MKNAEKRSIKEVGRVVKNNVKSFLGYASLYLPAPFMIATTIRRADEPSKIEKKLFSLKDIHTGKKVNSNNQLYDYDGITYNKNTHEGIGRTRGLCNMLVSSFSAGVSVLAIPITAAIVNNTPNMEKIDYWWIAPVALGISNAIDAICERNYIKKANKKFNREYEDYQRKHPDYRPNPFDL